MKIVLNYKKFLESNLDLDELSKDRNGEPRGNVLVRAIKNGDPVKVGQKNVVIDKMAKSGRWVEPNDAVDQITNPQGGYDPDKGLRYFKDGGKKYGSFNDVFLDEDGDDFGLDDIVKTEEFGSKGAGKSTLKFESLQCIFLGIKILNHHIVLDSENIEDCFRRYLRESQDFPIVKISEKVKVDFNLLGEYLKDDNWVESFCEIPNKLWHGNPVVDSSVDPKVTPDQKELRKRYLNEKINYLLFHTSYKGTESPYHILKQRFKEFAKIGGFSEIDYNKWCPADTYLIDETILDDFKSIVSESTNMYDFIKKCDELFDTQQLIPISLKKVKVGTPFKIITNGEIGADLPEFEITHFRVGSNLKGIGSKIDTKSQWKYRDEVVDTKDRTINFDSSDTGKKVNIDGEVEGSATRHGKINFLAIRRLINSNITNKQIKRDSLPRLLTYEEISKIADVRMKKSKLTKSEELKKWCLDLIDDAKEMQKHLGDTFNISQTRGKDIEGSVNKLISRIQSLQIVILMGGITLIDKELSKLIITKIMRYALSIQTDKFDTPRYLRVI